MKTTHLFRSAAAMLILASIAFTSCKKDKLEQGTNDPTALTQLTNDEKSIEDITNQAFQDVEGILSYDGGTYKSTERIICNATVDSTQVVNDTITIFITYNGLTCNGRLNRTGQVEIRKQVGTHWAMPGASVNVRYINFTVTRVATGHFYTLNSNKTFTNVTGGGIFMLGHNGFNTLVHRVSGDLNVVFDNGNSRIWHVARQRTYTGTQGALLLTIDGFGSSGDYNNLVTWGTNRNGEEFYTQINESIVLRETCDWDPVSGVKVHQIPSASKSATVTFGFNSNYEPITGDECPTHYRIDWVNGTYTGTAFLPLN